MLKQHSCQAYAASNGRVTSTFLPARFCQLVKGLVHWLHAEHGCVLSTLSCRRRREATFSTRHPDSRVPLIDAAKDVVTDTATGVMDYGVSSGEKLDTSGTVCWMEGYWFCVIMSNQPKNTASQYRLCRALCAV